MRNGDNATLRRQVADLKVKGFTVLAFARLADLNKSSVYKWLDGQFDYSDENIEKINQAVLNIKGL